MAAYVANGARLGWLLFPEQRAVEVWRTGDPEADPRQERLEPAETLDGGEAFAGLWLELAELWAVRASVSPGAA